MNGTKFKLDGRMLTLPVPAAGVTVGQALEIGGFFGFSQATIKAEDAEGEFFTLDPEGIFYCETEATGDISIGDAIYFDAAADPQFSNSAGRLVGYAYSETDELVLEDGETDTVLVKIFPMPKTTRAEAIEDAGGADA